MITIHDKKIGKNKPVFVIAEISGNHHHDLREAYKIIDAAAAAGADAIKLQTYTPDTITIESNKPEFVVSGSNKDWKGKTLYELYGEAYTPWEWHAELFAYAKKKGLICFSTPFDPTAVEFLEKLKVPLYKVASFEIVDIPLLEAIGKTKKPVIMSRGMATQAEIRLAINTLKKFGTKDIVLLHCVSAYPALPEEMNLATIADMPKKFGVSAGLSDHTITNESAIAAVALGACAIEKHLTLRRADGGPDASFSLEPHEFKSLVESVRTVEKALGVPTYTAKGQEKANIIFRKSLFVVKDIKKGERFTKEHVRSIRPGHGLAPRYYREVLKSRATRDIARATPLEKRHLKS